MEPVLRLATIERDYWQLASGEEQHAAHPDTFWIPDRDKRDRLTRGDAAKLIFEIEGEDAEAGDVEINRERMWVIVARRVGETYIGILDSTPATIESADGVYLVMGAEVPFRAEHVIDIARPPEEYIEWQLSQQPERVWSRAG